MPFPNGPIPPREVASEELANQLYRAHPDRYTRPVPIGDGRWWLYSRDPRARVVNENLAREACKLLTAPPAPPPSPGSSAAKAKLNDADRLRISEQVKKKDRDRDPDPPPQQPTLF